MEPQLTLDLFQTRRHDFEGFHAGGNAEALQALRQWAALTGPRVIVLRGASGSGKSHLLEAAIKGAAASGARAMYLPLRELLGAGVQLLTDLHHVDVVALDDIDACAGDARWEHALFNLHNEIQAAERRLLWSASSIPAFALADLGSRLAAGLIYQLRELSDADKADALRRGAERRGLELPETVVDFIMRRERRDMATLTALLDALDSASLSHQRALTIPFVKAVLSPRS